MRLQNCLIRFLEMVLASERLNYWLVVIASWGKKYRGDLIAGVIAFLIPFLITWALKGVGDIVAITSFFGLIVLLFILYFHKFWLNLFFLLCGEFFVCKSVRYNTATRI